MRKVLQAIVNDGDIWDTYDPVLSVIIRTEYYDYELDIKNNKQIKISLEEIEIED